jgi:phage shock protein C
LNSPPGRIIVIGRSEEVSLWQNIKNLKRSSTDKWIGGVCGGLGSATELPSWMWRAILLLLFLAYGVGVLVYLVLWITIPKENATH